MESAASGRTGLEEEEGGAPFPSSASTPGHSHRVDALRLLPDAQLASKSADGRVIIWALGKVEGLQQLASWKTDKAGRALGVTADGQVIVVGSQGGDVFAYSRLGEQLARFSPGKIRTPVLSCAVADDCSSVLASYAGGIIARWEIISGGDDTADEAADGGDGE